MYSSGEQIKDTLNFIWENNLILWKKIVHRLALFGKINSETHVDTINKYIIDYKNIYNQHSEIMRNYFVNDTTGELEILKIPGRK